MVFASVPAYFDPHNWNQHQEAGGSGVSRGTSGGVDGGVRHQLPTPVPTRPEGGGGSGSGFTAASIRPGSMAERARLAKIPQPEPALKCPRCDSTNTKFCYFNNYSLSQPRHFCKTCRRYWTRGGALRNVPVGGGCRRNKRSRCSSSKSSASNVDLTGTSSAGGVPPAGAGAIATHISAQSTLQFPFLTPLHPLPDYATTTTIGLNYGGLQTINVDAASAVDYHQEGGSSGSIGLEQWRLQQLQQSPFFPTLEHQTTPMPELGLYQFHGDSGSVDGTAALFAGRAHGKATTATGLITQLASAKMEECQQLHGLNLSRQVLGIPGNNDQYWSSSLGGGGSTGAGSTTTTAAGTGGWTTTADTSGFNPTTTRTGNLL